MQSSAEARLPACGGRCGQDRCGCSTPLAVTPSRLLLRRRSRRAAGRRSASACGRLHSSSTDVAEPDPDASYVANAIARREAPGGSKRSRGERQPDSRDHAKGAARRLRLETAASSPEEHSREPDSRVSLVLRSSRAGRHCCICRAKGQSVERRAGQPQLVRSATLVPADQGVRVREDVVVGASEHDRVARSRIACASGHLVATRLIAHQMTPP